MGATQAREERRLARVRVVVVGGGSVGVWGWDAGGWMVDESFGREGIFGVRVGFGACGIGQEVVEDIGGAF